MDPTCLKCLLAAVARLQFDTSRAVSHPVPKPTQANPNLFRRTLQSTTLHGGMAPKFEASKERTLENSKMGTKSAAHYYQR